MIVDTRIQEIAHASCDIKNLLMLSEECNELSQACAKLIRNMCWDKEIDGGTAENNLAEEIADVEICIDAIKCTYEHLVPKMLGYKEAKIRRAFDRAFKRKSVDN